jgi:hypothetical protein
MFKFKKKNKIKNIELEENLVNYDVPDNDNKQKYESTKILDIDFFDEEIKKEK